MPRSWGKKNERMYAHIKNGYRKAGLSMKNAKARAAATVNAYRTRTGQAKKK